MDWNRGPSAYQPNALPLGQTGSRKHQVTDLLTIVWEWELVGGWVGRDGGQGRDGVFLFLYLGLVDHSSTEPTAGPKTQTNPTITAEPYRGRRSA